MSNHGALPLLPILQSVNERMALCASCPKPGACCSNFVLTSGAFRTGRVMHTRGWKKRLQHLMDKWGLPFKPARVDASRGKLGFARYDCPKLLPNGLCGDYENRPDICRKYVPLENNLCVYPKRGDQNMSKPEMCAKCNELARLLVECRDTLPAITVDRARLHGVDLTLALRIETALQPWAVPADTPGAI
jgi:Fe-S-cluster containining protein